MGDTLTQYGYNFQIKVLSCLIVDRQFLSQIYDMIRPEYFDSDANQFLLNSILQYYQEYRIPPTLEVFKVQISNVTQELVKKEIISNLREVFKFVESTDLEFIKSTVLEFCKNQELKRAIMDSVDFLKNGDYDSIKRAVDAAMRKGVSTVIGHQYMEEVDIRYTEDEKHQRISTGWDVIDDVMSGGLPKKKMGIVMAPTGVGKTWVLCALGAAALKAGHTVLHITLELDEKYVGQRYDAILSGFTLESLPNRIPEVKKVLTKFNGKLLIKEFSPGQLSVNGLAGFIEKINLMGLTPDLVILDYAELMKLPAGEKVRSDIVLSNHYVELRGLAGIFNVALWSADQTNRGGSEKDVLGNADVSNSYGKIFALDFVMTVSRREKDKVANTARISISKNRLGPDGMVFPARFDTSCGNIEVFAERSDSGKKVIRDTPTDEDHFKMHAANRFEQLMNNNRREPDIF